MTPKELADRIGRGERWVVLNESKTEVKMPKPAIATTAFSRDSSTQPYYTEAQLKQYGDDRAREALENAAQLFEPAVTPAHGFYAKTIRALAKETK